jgi:hypothetical protein
MTAPHPATPPHSNVRHLRWCEKKKEPALRLALRSFALLVFWLSGARYRLKPDDTSSAGPSAARCLGPLLINPTTRWRQFGAVGEVEGGCPSGNAPTMWVCRADLGRMSSGGLLVSGSAPLLLRPDHLRLTGSRPQPLKSFWICMDRYHKVVGPSEHNVRLPTLF